MEIKGGDKVRVSKDAPKMYVPVSFWTEGNSIVEEIHEGNAAICYESNYVDFRIVVPIKYLLVNVNGVWKKPNTKPKRTRKVDAEAENKPNVGSIKIPVEVDLTDSYWDAYAADLAKEVALKVANKYNAPKEAADYAVSVAKAVVEGLKRK